MSFVSSASPLPWRSWSAWHTHIQIYGKFHLQKTENFQIKKKFWYFSYFSQNIDCGYSLEPPHWGGSNEYPKSLLLSKNERNNIYPCKPQFYYTKVGFKGCQNYIGVFLCCEYRFSNKWGTGQGMMKQPWTVYCVKANHFAVLSEKLSLFKFLLLFSSHNTLLVLSRHFILFKHRY